MAGKGLTIESIITWSVRVLSDDDDILNIEARMVQVGVEAGVRWSVTL